MARLQKHARLAIGVVGAVALLAPAAPAEASDVNWDAVAHCESSGNWGANTGNGYHGGLQFNRHTWRAYGGGKYSRTANGASRSEQIRVAEKVLRGQGIGAWPVCGRRAGSAKHHKGRNTSGSVSSKRTTAHRQTTHRATHKRTTSDGPASRQQAHRTTRPAKRPTAVSQRPAQSLQRPTVAFQPLAISLQRHAEALQRQPATPLLAGAATQHSITSTGGTTYVVGAQGTVPMSGNPRLIYPSQHLLYPGQRLVL